MAADETVNAELRSVFSTTMTCGARVVLVCACVRAWVDAYWYVLNLILHSCRRYCFWTASVMFRSSITVRLTVFAGREHVHGQRELDWNMYLQPPIYLMFLMTKAPEMLPTVRQILCVTTANQLALQFRRARRDIGVSADAAGSE